MIKRGGLMGNMPLISLIVPVYNVRPYIRQCLDSVTRQTYSNLEILVIDDGSTDGCSSLCDEYASKDDRIIVFHTTNQGLSAARNIGLDHISNASEFVAFLDSDDWMETQTIQALYDAATENQADIACCLYCNEYVNSSQLISELNQPKVVEREQILNCFICERNIGNVVWNKLYKTKLFSTLRFPYGKYYEDIAITYKVLLSANKVVIIPDLLIHYRMRKNSISQERTLKSLSDRWRSYYKKYEDLYAVISDAECHRFMVGDCMDVIGYMWRWYYSFSPYERISASTILDEMQIFSKKHFDEIIHNKSYSVHQRISSFFSRSRNPLIMRVLYFATKICKRVNHYEKYTF